MTDFVYEDILRKEEFNKFHELGSQCLGRLWTALEVFLRELGEILVAAAKKGVEPKAVMLGSEQALSWLVVIKGTPLMITGKYDLLLYDHRYETSHLMDFKLCGVKRDLASTIQVMLYSLMLNRDKGIEPGATVLNLHSQRSPIPVPWEHIKIFEKPLLAFIEEVAALEFPGLFEETGAAPDPTQELNVPNTPFETPVLLKKGKEHLKKIADKLTEFKLPVDAYKGAGGAILVGPAFTVVRVEPGTGVKVASVANRGPISR